MYLNYSTLSVTSYIIFYHYNISMYVCKYVFMYALMNEDS